MREYAYTPKTARRKPAIVVCFLVLVSLLLILVSGSFPYRALWQAGGFCGLVAALFIAGSYLLREYTYRIVQRETGFDEEEPVTVYDFEILQNGKPVCRIGLDRIAEVRMETEEKDPSPFRGRIYTYRASWDKSRRCRLVFLDRETDDPVPVMVRFFADEELLELLRRGIVSETAEQYNSINQ
ncbi:MAG: hypothetical protein ILO68_00730 [Clostridia bacterium]|nr:hypothetical protein [Clostridia bacterium]